MSKTFEYESTSISNQLSLDFLNSGYNWPESRSKDLFKTVFDAIATYLKFYQSKNEEKIVFKLKDEKGEFKFGAALNYQKPEEGSEDDSGNWYLEFSFYEDALEGYTKEIDNLSDTFYTVISERANKIMYGSFKSATLMNVTCILAIDAIRKWLDSNASEDEEVILNLDGVFTASVVVEGGKKIMSIVPGETIKQIIKNDSIL